MRKFRGIRRLQRLWRWCGVLLLLVFALSEGSMLLVGPDTIAKAAGTTVPGKQGERSECTSTASHGTSFGRTVVIDTNEVVCTSLTSFGGTIAINGQVRGDVTGFGSDIIIVGTVDGHIELYGGQLILQSSSQVHGNIDLYGSNWTRGKGSVLEGDVIDHTRHINWFIPDNSGFSFPFWPLLIWVALGILITSLLPEHVMFVRTTAIHKIRRSVTLGILSVLLAPLIIAISIALILPIPLAIIIALGLMAAWALGTVAVGWVVGEYIVRKIAPRYNTRLVQVAVGLGVLVLAGAIPYVGWLIPFGAGLLGLGAVLLSRFGTRLYSQPKKPLSL